MGVVYLVSGGIFVSPMAAADVVTVLHALPVADAVAVGDLGFLMAHRGQQ